MPLVGLVIGYAVSLFVSNIMHILGPLLLIGVGLWELQEEIRERISKRKKHQSLTTHDQNVAAPLADTPSGGREAPVWTARGAISRISNVTRSPAKSAPTMPASAKTTPWSRQLLLALSVSMDELAIGFSLGAITSSLPGNKTISTFTLCILIGLQGFLMTLIGLTLGRTLRSRLTFVKDWTEFLSCFLLIALGIWLFVT
jgi:putative Mn2+ efflux pump MntP